MYGLLRTNSILELESSRKRLLDIIHHNHLEYINNKYNTTNNKNNNHKQTLLYDRVRGIYTGPIASAWPLGAASEELSSDKDAVGLRRTQGRRKR